MNRPFDPNITKRILEYQKQMLDYQKSAFENYYNAMRALQERQLEFYDRMTNQIPDLPDQARDMIQVWREAAEAGQRQFKNTVDGSFAAVKSYLDRLAEGQASATEEDAPASQDTQEATKAPSSDAAAETEESK